MAQQQQQRQQNTPGTQGGDYIIPGAQAVSEWYSRIGGVIAGCGEAALAVMEGISSGNPPTIQQVTMLILTAIRNGWSSPTGVTTPRGLANLGAATGNPLTIGPGGNSVFATIEANLAQGKPTEIGVSNARAFGGSDAGVRGHYVTVVGKNANTGQYIVADPNQPEATSGGFVRYSMSQISNALPFASLTPQNASHGGLSNPFNINFNPFSDLFNSFGTNAQDFAWRFALIGVGMLLVVLGMVMFFGHQEGQVATVVVQQAGNAAKAGAAAAAA